MKTDKALIKFWFRFHVIYKVKINQNWNNMVLFALFARAMPNFRSTWCADVVKLIGRTWCTVLSCLWLRGQRVHIRVIETWAFVVFADSSRGSDPALARDALTSSPKGSPKQQRAHSAVRLIDIKREASMDVASTSNAQLIAPVVAVSSHNWLRANEKLYIISFSKLQICQILVISLLHFLFLFKIKFCVPSV